MLKVLYKTLYYLTCGLIRGSELESERNTTQPLSTSESLSTFNEGSGMSNRASSNSQYHNSEEQHMKLKDELHPSSSSVSKYHLYMSNRQEKQQGSPLKATKAANDQIKSPTVVGLQPNSTDHASPTVAGSQPNSMGLHCSDTEPPAQFQHSNQQLSFQIQHSPKLQKPISPSLERRLSGTIVKQFSRTAKSKPPCMYT